MVMKLYLHLTTLCGCTKIIEHPFVRLVPTKWIVALPAPVRFSDAPPDLTADFPRRRTFELCRDGVQIGENEYVYYYKEIAE